MISLKFAITNTHSKTLRVKIKHFKHQRISSYIHFLSLIFFFSFQKEKKNTRELYVPIYIFFCLMFSNVIRSHLSAFLNVNYIYNIYAT